MSNLSSQRPDDIREQLSAWHDGALDAEPARFLQRRLDGDEGLRASLGRWQLIGDVMRGVPSTAAAPGLSEAVFAQLDAEQSVQRQASGARRTRALGWWGAGLAAGLGAFLLIPLPSNAPDQSTVAIAVPPAPLVARSSLPVPAFAQPKNAVSPLALPSTDMLIASAVPPLVRAPQPSAAQLAPLPAVDAPSRPWPRSSAADEGYTVSYRVEHGADGSVQR